MLKPHYFCLGSILNSTLMHLLQPAAFTSISDAKPAISDPQWQQVGCLRGQGPKGSGRLCGGRKGRHCYRCHFHSSEPSPREGAAVGFPGPHKALRCARSCSRQVAAHVPWHEPPVVPREGRTQSPGRQPDNWELTRVRSGRNVKTLLRSQKMQIPGKQIPKGLSSPPLSE